MSLRRKTELAFKSLLQSSGITFQCLTSQENDGTTVDDARVIIQAHGHGLASPKSRNQRYLVTLHIEQIATWTDQDERAPELLQADNVAAVHQALEDLPGGLAAALSAQRDAIGGDFTCFFVLPQGDVDSEPSPKLHLFRDSVTYLCTVAESDSD